MSATPRPPRDGGCPSVACPACCSRRRLALGLAVSLSGCGEKPGSAGIIDGRRISVNEVQSAAKSLRATDPTNFGKLTDSQVLSILLVGPYAEAAASAAGHGVSDDLARQAVLQQAQQNGGTAHVALLNEDALTALRGEVALSQLDATTESALVKQIQRADIEVAPRYGTFDSSTGNITAPAPNWIQPAPAKPTATPSPSPTASG